MFECINFNKETQYIVLVISGQFYGFDKVIAEKIGIKTKDYQQILFNFGAHEDEYELYFNDRTEAKKAADYLNEVYGIMFKLME